ncbi:MAG: SAM-dependent methyltransferase [Chloroflexota bacterium]
MGVNLNQVVPWGRLLEEYTGMFDLNPSELQKSILDCAGGPSSFNVEMTQQGHPAISCDPLYQFGPDEIAHRVEETHQIIIDGVRATLDGYIGDHIKSPEQLVEIRMSAMQQFLSDFPNGLAQGRYIVGELPVLPFDRDQFDLALCSHFLFTYSEQLSADFHLASIIELCRVAREVRIFPLLVTGGGLSPHLPFVKDALAKQGYQLEVRHVDYEFQKDANELLRVWK